MLEALPVGILSRQLADTVPEVELLTIEGYPKILKLILGAHQAYLEAELEKAALDFMYPRTMEKTELYTTYVAYLELLGRELDQQLHPAPPIDERIKAVVLLKHCILDKEQRTQLALKRAGTQPFQKVADMLRTLVLRFRRAREIATALDSRSDDYPEFRVSRIPIMPSISGEKSK